MTPLRLGLAVVGFALALVGVLRDDRRITGAAIVVLAVAVLLRMYHRRQHPESK